MDLATPALPAAGPAPQPPAGGSHAPVSRLAAAVRAPFAGQTGPVEIAVAVET
ncbi:MAG: hypothetical protein JWR86_2366, partial [Enterovirga sp.]|nr:hypothetical protein [Enterovirga sp.]